jgi:hypothetical protein
MNENLDDFHPERNYYMNVRRFASGLAEAVVKTVRPMAMEQFKKRYEESGAISPRHGSSSSSELSDSQRQENHDRAVRRSKQSIRFLCKEAGVDRLLTLTYRENMQDRERLYDDFKRFVRLVRKQHPDWMYVAVPELQDRGAFHVHIAVRGWQRVDFLRRCWYRALGGTGTERGEHTPGAVNVTSPRGKRTGWRQWETSSLASYISKYVSKTFSEVDAEKRRFWASKMVQKPKPYRVWLVAASMPQAIHQAYQALSLGEGLGPDFKMWLSISCDSFWISGRCHDGPV